MTIDLDGAIAAVAERLRASTVRVHDRGGRGSGSGIVWNDAGLVLTNAHVVRGNSATVEAADGKTRGARLVRRDDQRDLAALQLDDFAGLLPAERRDSATLVPGELVVAVGNPLGFVGAVTAGLVHRCNTRWVIADVRLAPGNSGGPLADAEGRVAGINSMVAGGLALAIPSAAVTAFLNEADRPRLGVRLARVAPTRRTRGFLILEIDPGSVAERSGLQLGDTILADDVSALAGVRSLDIVRGGKLANVPISWSATPEDSRAA